MQKTPETPTPEELIVAMNAALSYGPGDDMELVLLRQAQALDLVFRVILQETNTGRAYCRLQHYQAAFKAQAQCRNTIKAIAALKKVPAASLINSANELYKNKAYNKNLPDAPLDA